MCLVRAKAVYNSGKTINLGNQYEDQGLGTHDWALDVDDSETHNLP